MSPATWNPGKEQPDRQPDRQPDQNSLPIPATTKTGSVGRLGNWMIGARTSPNIVTSPALTGIGNGQRVQNGNTLMMPADPTSRMEND